MQDLITYFPRDYEDRSKPKLIADVEDGEEVLIEAVCTSRMLEARIRKNMTIYKLIVKDESGTCRISWFNQKYLKNRFEIGKTYRFFGKASKRIGYIEMNSPVFDEETMTKNTGKIIPIYPLTYELSRKCFKNNNRKWIKVYR